MAKKNNESVKQAGLKRKMLLGFVFISVLMIGGIWIQAIRVREPETPSYYRDSYQVDDSIYLTVTADALKYNPDPATTPQANEDSEEDHGSGHGQGAGQGSGQGGGGGGGEETDH